MDEKGGGGRRKLNLGAGGGRDFIDRILEVNQHVLRGKYLLLKLEP
jgi:hypothetical protein